MDMTAQVTQLERELQDLILQWDRFFSGDRRQPPQKERERLSRRLRLLSEHGSGARATMFRFEQLQHRFSTYNALWERQLREREEGRRAAVPRHLAVGTANEEGSPSVQRKEEAGGDLYDQYVAARAALGEKVALAREQFEEKLARQRKVAESKLGGPVRFEVFVDGSKVKIAARAVNGRNGGK